MICNKPTRQIRYVENRDPVMLVPSRVANVLLRTREFYRYGTGLVRVFDDGKFDYMTTENLNAHLASFLEIQIYHKAQNGKLSFRKATMLNGEQIGILCRGPELLRCFPEITVFSKSPLFDTRWNFVGSPGYHKDSGIYYCGDKINPKKKKRILKKVLSEFPWKSEADQVNYYGVLLTAITIPHWIGKHSAVAFNGTGFNGGVGVGKDLLARIIALIFDGKEPSSISKIQDTAEFERSLSGPIKSGARVIVVSNIKSKDGLFDNQVLEKMITDRSLSFRILSKNERYSRPNDVIFCMTMNHTKLSADLQRRQLPINLHREEDPATRSFKIPDLDQYILEHRADILGELAGMVMKWLDKKKPLPRKSPGHSMGQPWAKTMNAILKADGMDGFLSNFEESVISFDPDEEVIKEACLQNVGVKATPHYWTPLLTPLMPQRLNRGNISERAQDTIVGQFFSKFSGKKIYVENRTFLVERHDRGQGHPAEYEIKEVINEAKLTSDSLNE